MSKAKTLSEAAERFGLSKTDEVQALIDAIVDVGHSPEVYHRHDDFLGLDGDISQELKEMSIAQADETNNDETNNDECSRILDEANTVYTLSEKELSDDEREDYEQEQDDIESFVENINK
ncbi:hypothetical protein [Avibacterium avium]|uniref:Uncharacterized protein n=1 Tax=Avibacterium avium TaxID=751 RepID=A0A379AQS6_AVIAV|nr:hypothetical protein [Avibacterium avium]SUB23940.1 Uncharacterised protein [Avibacterium avium]